jgi:hypothetical protein
MGPQGRNSLFERFAGATRQAREEGAVVHANHLGRCFQRNLLVANRHDSVPSRVVGLLRAGCPAAVLRLVVAVVVFALQGEAVRAWAHVANKAPEVVHPLGAHPNAARAVVLKVFAATVHAAPSRVKPGSIFAGPMPLGVVLESRRGYISPATSAALGMRRAEILAGDDVFSAAYASATPAKTPSSRRRCFVNDDQTSEATPDEVFGLPFALAVSVGRQELPAPAATTNRLPANQMVRKDDLRFTAITHADPLTAHGFRPESLDDPSAESPS